MTAYTMQIARLKQDAEQVKQINQKILDLQTNLQSATKTYCAMIEALQLLATVSDSNTKIILNYLTGVINKTLAEIFPHDPHRIYLEKTIYSGQYVHINVRLEDKDGNARNLQSQTGTGVRQVIAFLFTLSLIEIRKGRRIIIADELLSGLHPEAKRIVMDIIQIFAEEGFQFIFVEYGVNDIGKVYLVEKPSNTATVSSLDGAYNNEVFIFNPPADFDTSVFVNEGDSVEGVSTELIGGTA